VAAIQFAKTQGVVRSPEYLGLGVLLGDPFRDCPACALHTRDQLNDGEWGPW
jgi:hypothetical protein